MATSATRLVVLGFLASCVRPGAIDCGDGVVCSEGTTCVHATPEVTLCVDPDRRSLCRNTADDELCDGERGRCYDGACIAIACGDRLIDPGTPGLAPEACDDGNLVSGDGCAANCRSDETCGNGVVDVVNDEQCDDGAPWRGRSHDGCSSSCRRESAIWTYLPPTGIAASGGILVFDARRGRLVHLGQEDVAVGGSMRVTEWNGARWSWPRLREGPVGRPFTSAAYDVARGQVVMFGGGGFADTWTYDGANWREHLLETRPLPRSRAAMTYDHVRRRVLLFGGRDMSFGNGARTDTWSWDGSAWSHLGDGGPERIDITIASDPARGRVLAFGGLDPMTLQPTDTTYELVGTTWHLVTPATSPPPLRNPLLAFDASMGRLVLAGRAAGGAYEHWSWDGATWSREGGSTISISFEALSPTPSGGIEAWNANHERFEWNGTAWLKVRAFGAPTPELSAEVAYDPERGIALLRQPPSTYIWDGEWSSAGIGAGPSASSKLAFDRRRGQFVAFGGNPSETWEWSNGWTRRSGTQPPPRSEHVLVYDEARGVTLLFGGRNGVTFHGDTWTWDGSSWSQVTGVGPPARSGASAIYDPVARSIVIFGGVATQAHADTWTWDGAWHPVVGAGPSARWSAAFAWSASAQRGVLHGGFSGSSPLADTWEWNGTSWERLVILSPIAPRSQHAMFASPEGSGVVLYGGSLGGGATANVPTNDVIWLDWRSDSPDETCGPVDADHDELVGVCDPELPERTVDPDCWATCRPSCLAPGPCPSGCGDGTCNRAYESAATCPADCPVLPPICGDGICVGGETLTSCPGDC